MRSYARQNKKPARRYEEWIVLMCFGETVVDYRAVGFEVFYA